MAGSHQNSRRYQFRLRTLMIVVTLPAMPMGYLGWQAKIVRARCEFLKSHQSLILESLNYKVHKDSISCLRKRLGDDGLDDFVLYSRNTEDVLETFPRPF